MTSSSGGGDGERRDTAPAFDWNPTLSRITWANRAGAAFWGAASPADLCWRLFAPHEETARVLGRQSDLLKTNGIGSGWFTLAPDAEMLLCRADRSQGRTDGAVRLEIREIVDPTDNTSARALAAFENGPTPQALVSPSGAMLFRNDADRALFPAATRFEARFREPGEARRALRAAIDGDGYSHTAEVTGARGVERLQVVYRRLRDPATGKAAILCAMLEAPEAEKESRARIAHDLRSPLNAIQGFAEYIDFAGENLSGAERSSYLADIQSACAAMLTIVETLIDDDAPEADAEPFDLMAVADAVTRIHKPRAQREGGDITLVSVRTGAAMGDAGKARRIIDNLIDNAIRHGGARVTVLVDGAAITISDGGVGDGAPVTLTRVGGIGLRNCHDLATGMGASLSVTPLEQGGVSAHLSFASGE